MPASLPESSAYTFAAEFSVDEARALGATGVRFSQPVATWVDNFLDAPLCTVPRCRRAGMTHNRHGGWLSRRRWWRRRLRAAWT